MRTLSETIQAITPVMTACIDSSTGLINYHNPRFLKRTGYTSDQVLNRSIFQFIHECTFIQLAKALKDIKYNSSLTLRVGLKASPYTQITHPINHWRPASYKYHPAPANNLARYS